MKTINYITTIIVVLVLAGTASANTLLLTVETCYRSAAVAYLNDDPGDTGLRREHMLVKGWFEPGFETDRIEVDVGDNKQVYLHVSFFDHGLARLPFTADDASFCVNNNKMNFETRMELPLPHQEYRLFYEAYTEGERGETVSKLHRLTPGTDCPDTPMIMNMANFEYLELDSETTVIDICAY